MAVFAPWFIGNRFAVAGLARALGFGGVSGNHVFFSGRVFLFWGPEELGKRTLALAIANALLQGSTDVVESLRDLSHPDFLFVQASEESGNPSLIGIDQARAVRNFLSSTPLSSERKVVVVDGVEYLSAEAANALLKTLEEPPQDAACILIAHETSRVLATIQSRALPVRFVLVDDAELSAALKERGVAQKDAAVIRAVADGRPGRALRFAQDAETRAVFQRRRDAIVKLIDGSMFSQLSFIARARQKDASALRVLPQWWMSFLRPLLWQPQRAMQAVSTLERLFIADRLLTTMNGNPELILETALTNNPSNNSNTARSEFSQYDMRGTRMHS